MQTAVKTKTSTKPSSVNSRMLVKLDHRTTIVLQKKSLFQVWKKRYPDAKIIQLYNN